MKRLLIFLVIILLNCSSLLSQGKNESAPGAPGKDAHWPTAAKSGFGTANTVASKVWFTLADGVMSEVYYPTLDVPNVQSLQLIIVTPEGKTETESEDTSHRIQIMDNGRSLSFRQENRAKSGDYIIYKDYLTDPLRNAVMMHVAFKALNRDSSRYKLYVYYDPSLNNSGMHDSAWTDRDAMLSSDADKASALIAEPAFTDTTNGYLGVSDGLSQLRAGSSPINYKRATDGNVVQVARTSGTRPVSSDWVNFTISLGFGNTPAAALTSARGSLREGFTSIYSEYQEGWHGYVSSLPAIEPKYQPQFNMSAMVLEGLEDKTWRGAFIASPSIPWGGGPNANEATVSGYHAVWSRDLYQVATAFYAMGDRPTALRALDYLFKVQQKPDGSFPQISTVAGRPIGDGLQMDEVALPLVLAWQLGRTDRKTWLEHIKPAADFILRRGPTTGQERWEEESGYSPSTIAAEIAGLVCAASIARHNGDGKSSAAYLQMADDWALNVERWTGTAKGKYGDGKYFLRITENGNPDVGGKIEINSGGGVYEEREIVDAGFLELVRLGIRSPEDPLVRNSLAVVDELLKVETSFGDCWYRYNHDAYGERPDGKPYDGKTGVGRLWTLLTGERGEYELASGQGALARRRLDAMMSFANDGRMIPEQVWDRRENDGSSFQFGSGTGSATPLAWSMAQFIRLAVNIRNERNTETPQVVFDRYISKSRKEK
jgi:glucoamylase